MLKRKPRVYYNENDPFVADWLENLIEAGHLPDGKVDRRSIQDVKAEDLQEYEQCHFFAGIGGWPLALRLAGWGSPVWTGSCPCQPFSSAGNRGGFDDERHLWPVWFHLIKECRPPVIFGEQVASAHYWIDSVWDDMEDISYSFWTTVLPALCVGQDHKRDRFYFVGYSNDRRQPVLSFNAEAQRVQRYRCDSEGVEGEDGVSNRMGLLRAYGNAIVPQVAAEFVKAYMNAQA